MANEKSVTNEGVPQELDLGHVEPPTSDAMNSLDDAMREAGIFEPGEAPEPEPEPKSEPETAADPGDELPPDASKEPAETDSVVAEETPTDLNVIDLDAIEPPKDISPRNLVNFDKLRDVAKHFKTQASRVPELEQQLQQLQTGQSLPEDVLNELAELRTMRKIFDTENDPEFKKEFDEKVQGIDDDVLAILRKNGLPEETEKQLRQLGLDKVAPKWWEDSILDKLSFVDQERVRKRLAERADISENRAKAIEQFQSNRESFAQHLQQQQQNEQLQSEHQIFEHVDRMTEKVPWARYQEIPAGAKPEDVKKIEQHNATVKDLETRFVEALYPQNPQARAEVAAAAVASIKLAESVTDLSERLQAANERAEKAEKSMEAVRVAGKAPSARQGSRKPATDEPDPNKMSDEDAIEQGLMAAESAMS
jgi:hypothetical protein